MKNWLDVEGWRKNDEKDKKDEEDEEEGNTPAYRVLKP
jgi:hypothetical protein